MIEHTPGPWTYFIGNANGRGLIRIETSIDAPQAGIHIASMTRGAVSEANARLIAAAPDLLAAIQKHAENLDAYLRGNRPRHNELKLAAETRAAIAKAKKQENAIAN